MGVSVTAQKEGSSTSEHINTGAAVGGSLPVAAVGACAVALAWEEHGSIDPGSWLPYSIVIALVLAIVLAAGAAARPGRAASLGIGGLVALGGWAALTLLWAPSPALARDEGLLTATYALALAVAALTARHGARLAATVVVAAGSGGVAAAAAAVLVWGADPLGRYFGGRLAFPISYVNATGALLAVGVWPGVLLAARRSAPPVARAAALAAAAAALAGVATTQSKGAVLGLLVATAVVLSLSPHRLRLLLPLALPVAAVAAAFGPLTEPFRSPTPEAVRTAGAAVLVVAAAAAAVGLVYAALDPQIAISERASRLAGRVLLAALVAALAAGVAGFVVRVDHPGAWFAAKWRAAHHLSAHRRGSTHLLQLGSNRFDFWRVAWDEFERHPLLGDGARGFGPAYLVHGRSAETPRRAHSLPLEVLSEQGVVGFALLALGLGAPLALVLRRLRRGDPAAAAAAGGALAWLVQACVDWTWTIPAVTIPPLLLLGAAAARARGGVAGRAAGPLAVALVAFAALALAPPWLAARYTQRGIAQRSQADLDRAHRLDPLSTDPLTASVWVEPLGAALPRLREAARMEPRMVATRYLLGAAYLALGDRRAARAQLRAALRLKPGDPTIEAALRRSG